MRLFIAIELPSSVVDYLTHVQQDVRMQSFFDGRYVKPEHFHSTLAFFPDQNEADVEKLTQRLHALTVLPFDVTLGSLDVDNASKPSVVWVNLMSDDLTAIIKQVRDSNDRPIRPHSTLARVKYLYDKEGLLDFIQTYSVKALSFTVRAIILMRSQLTPEGPQYETLFTHTLSSS